MCRFSALTADAGLILRSTDEQLGPDAYSGYYAGLRTHDGRLVLGRANYGWLESQTTTFPTGIKTQHWYHLQVAAVGCTVAAVATDLTSGVRSTVSMQGQPCVHQGQGRPAFLLYRRPLAKPAGSAS